MDKDHHLGSSPDLVKRLVKYAKERSCSKILDLGSGEGIVLQALAENGFQPYGVEEDPEYIRMTRERFAAAGLRQPQLLNADYHALKVLSFEDGTTIKDIDFFYCYSYNEEHAHEVFANLLTGVGARIGSFAWITSLRPYKGTKLAGFKTPWFNDVLEKIAERNVTYDLEITPSKYADHHHSSFFYRVI